MVSMATPHMTFENREYAYKFNHILGFTYLRSTKIGVKVKLRHVFFSCCQICKSTNLHVYEY